MTRPATAASIVLLCACLTVVVAATPAAASGPGTALQHEPVDTSQAGVQADGSAALAQGSTADGGGAGDMLLLVGALVVIVGLVGAAVWQSGALSRGAEVTADSAASAAGAAAESAGRAGEATAPPEEELLSDSDRVRKLLRENGGRMKQVNIVAETEWSKSKVSMLLSEMDEEGEISKLRVGRENIISLSGHEPDAAGSPFEDEE